MNNRLSVFRKIFLGGIVFGLIWAVSPATVYAEEAAAAYYDEQAAIIYYEEAVYEEAASIYEEEGEEPAILYYEEAAAYKEEAAENIPTYFRTTSNLRLRIGPSLDDGIVRTVPNGSTVRVFDKRCGEWFSVYVNGDYGYMYAEFLVPISSDSGQAPLAQVDESPVEPQAEENPAELQISAYGESPAEPQISAYGESPAELQISAYGENPAELQISAYGVELIYWSEARDNIIRRGVPLHITDVRTGTTFWLESFSNGSHADVVPRTRDDTEALRSIFGGRWTWDPRAILVTVDGRTFAASISGMPHGSFNRLDNGMRGHICMHFPGSRTHNGNRSHERDHQNRIQDAFRAAR